MTSMTWLAASVVPWAHKQDCCYGVSQRGNSWPTSSIFNMILRCLLWQHSECSCWANIVTSPMWTTILFISMPHTAEHSSKDKDKLVWRKHLSRWQLRFRPCNLLEICCAKFKMLTAVQTQDCWKIHASLHWRESHYCHQSCASSLHDVWVMNCEDDINDFIIVFIRSELKTVNDHAGLSIMPGAHKRDCP